MTKSYVTKISINVRTKYLVPSENKFGYKNVANILRSNVLSVGAKTISHVSISMLLITYLNQKVENQT